MITILLRNYSIQYCILFTFLCRFCFGNMYLYLSLLSVKMMLDFLSKLRICFIGHFKTISIEFILDEMITYKNIVQLDLIN